MEALPVDRLPLGDGWQFEPKWDGFRCLAYRDGDEIELQSKAGQPLARYFPELVERLRALPSRFVLDGEIVVPVDGKLSFDDLLQRIHPAPSRIARLARERPAVFIAFDLLVDDHGRSLLERPLRDRRGRLESFAGKFPKGDDLRLSPATTDVARAQEWLASAGADLDGVIAKRLDLAYQSGTRTGMQKVKRLRTADCVVGGFRHASAGDQQAVGSLLLGLYDSDGLLHHVGFTSSFKAAERPVLLAKLLPLVKPPGFSGRAPGGPSRWSTERSAEWVPLAPKLVVEVRYDHFTGGRFRHGTKLLRWRPDKAPRQCTMEQVLPGAGTLGAGPGARRSGKS
jgi:ATP-dependent DNA ligase